MDEDYNRLAYFSGRWCIIQVVELHHGDYSTIRVFSRCLTI